MSDTEPPTTPPKDTKDSKDSKTDEKQVLLDELTRLKHEKAELEEKSKKKETRESNKVLSELEKEVEALKADLQKEREAKEKEKVKFLSDSLINAGYEAADLKGYNSEDLEKVIKLLSSKDGKIRIPRNEDVVIEPTAPVIELWDPVNRLVKDWNKRFETDTKK